MEVGTEISQKIRSAIKAKLIELGAYVDDELPDYIMVMVANKKSKDQMVSDLKLFLGANTNTFAEWLHGLLSKLQTISVDSAKNVKDKKSDSKKEKKKSKSSKSGDGSTTKSKNSSKKTEVVKKSVTVVETEENSETGKLSKSKTDVDTRTEQPTDVEDVRQMLVTVAPTDELAAELETTESKIEQSHVKKGPQSKGQAKSASSVVSQRKRSVSPESQRKIQSSLPKKHKGLISVVANVSKDEEEEYDPLCPAVGSVASVVVTNRKSRLPPSLQANSVTGDGEQTKSEEEQGPVDADGIKATAPDGCPMVRLEDTASLSRIRSVLTLILRQEDIARSQHDDVHAFCAGVAASLRKMNQRDLAIAKLKIQKIIFDYESCVQSGKGGAGVAASTSQSRLSAWPSSLSQSHDSTNVSTSNNDAALLLSSRDNATKASNSTHPSSATCSSNHPQEPARAASVLRPSWSSPSSGAKHEDSVTSSRNDQPSPSCGGHLAIPASSSNVSLSSPAAMADIGSSSSSSSLSPFLRKLRGESHLAASSSKTIDVPSASPPTISLDSLHQKRRSELDSVSKNSVLKIRPLLHIVHENAGSTSNTACENSGTDSPKPLSAEQLKVLAKNLKITVTNFRALKSNAGSDEESSSEDSEEESDSDEESDVEEVGGLTASKQAAEVSAGVGESESAAGVGESGSAAGVGESESAAGVGESESAAGVGETESAAGVGESESAAGVGESESAAGIGESESAAGIDSKGPEPVDEGLVAAARTAEWDGSAQSVGSEERQQQQEEPATTNNSTTD